MDLNKFVIWILVINGIGSIVDIFQFTWIMKRLYRRTRDRLYRRIKRRVLAELREKGELEEDCLK